MNYVINLLLLLMITSVQAQVTLRFKSSATSDADHLGQLLVITPDTDNWSALSLGAKPRAKTLLAEKQVIHWLVSKVGAFDYKWEGKHTLLIEAVAHTSSKELIAKAKNALALKLNPHQYTRYELEPITKPAESSIVLSHFKTNVVDRFPPLKRTCVHLNDGSHSIPIWFKVKAYQKVLVAKQKLKHRTSLKASDFNLEERNIAGLKSIPLIRVPKTFWLNRSLSSNSILTKEYLSLKPSIVKGQQVRVEILNEDISIITQATAQHDAFVGQNLKLLNQNSNQLFIAKVKAYNLAEVKA